MKQQSYRVVLEGTVKQGFQRSHVLEKLSKIFKKDIQVMDKLLSGTSKPIRSGLGLDEATKYKRILEAAGAGVRVEPEPLDHEVVADHETRAPGTRRPEPEPPAVAKPRRRPPSSPTLPPDRQTPPEPTKPPGPASGTDKIRPLSGDTKPEPSPVTVCPKCGYEPRSPQDVLLVRGDCPRCGLRVRQADTPEEKDTSEAEYLRRKRRPEAIYFDRTPASWDRRTVATLHTFGAFLAVYTGLVLLFIFALVPLESLVSHLETAFLATAVQDFPVFMISVAIFVVCFVAPIFNKGLTWGQRLAGIEVLYTTEAQVGGLYVTLILRTIVALALTFGPAWVILWLGGIMDLFYSSWSVIAVTIISAGLAWTASALYAWCRADMRSVFDLATGTLQVEEGLLADDAFGKACKRLIAVVGFWIFVGWVVPFAVRHLGWVN